MEENVHNIQKHELENCADLKDQQLQEKIDKSKSLVEVSFQQKEKDQQTKQSMNLTQKGYICFCLLITLLLITTLLFGSEPELEEGGNQTYKQLSSEESKPQPSAVNSPAIDKIYLNGLCINELNVNLSISSLQQNDRLGGHIRKHVDCYNPKGKNAITSCFLNWDQFVSIFHQVPFDSLDECNPNKVDERNNIVKEHKLGWLQNGIIKKYRTDPQSCIFSKIKIVYKLINLRQNQYYWIVLTAYPSDCQ